MLTNTKVVEELSCPTEPFKFCHVIRHNSPFIISTLSSLDILFIFNLLNLVLFVVCFSIQRFRSLSVFITLFNGWLLFTSEAPVPFCLQLGRFLWMGSSSVSCFEDTEGIGSSTCLRCSRKAFAFCSNRCCVRGLVRSPVSATLPQIVSRLYLTWGILRSFPETRTHVLVSSLLISWSITEIIRYSFFGMKEAFGFTPSWLLWLRYSTFLLLYPTGISSEVGLICIALPFIKASEKYCIRMPNKWNSSFDYFYAAIVALGIYVPGSPHMYRYMLGQRKKALPKSKRE